MIINLTKTKEYGKVKCDQYWPSEVGESFQFEENNKQMQIILISCESLMKSLIRRKLKIIADGKELHEVIQLNYLSWPDHGAPEVTDFQIIRKLIDFTQEYHSKPVEDNSKIVFHCSAGIGRTGTMLAIYNIIESLKILLDQP